MRATTAQRSVCLDHRQQQKDNIFYILRHDFGGSKHTLKRKARAKGKKWRTGIRGQRSGIGGSYHLREAQVPYNSDFTTENSDLRADNAYF
jgi:hypothetical protein